MRCLSHSLLAQAWGLVTLEFLYRFMYACYVLGEIGPLATSILPAFRSSSIVLKTLLPQSTMLGASTRSTAMRLCVRT